MAEKQKQPRLKQQITATFSIQKLIHKQRKYHFENSDGVDHIKSKKCSLTIITLYGDLARIKRNCYTGSVCGYSPRKPH